MSRRVASTCVMLLMLASAASLLDARAPQHKQHKKFDDERAQTPRPPGFILGQVVDAGSGQPVAAATVTLITEVTPGRPPQPAAEQLRSLTGDDGRFLFRRLDAGRYRLTVSAPGYLAGAFGQRRPDTAAMTLILDDGQRMDNVTIRLWREATIAGTVTDDTGAPVPQVLVGLLRRNAGGSAGPAVSEVATTLTDDLGAFRLSGIAPGSYVVAVPSRIVQESPPPAPAVRIGDVFVQTTGTNVLVGRLPFTRRADGRIVGYGSAFHPAASTLDSAATITVGAGDRRDDVDIRLRPIALSRVSGTVTGPAGPEPGISVALIPAFAVGQRLERTYGTATAQTGATGTFTFPIVPPGPYVLRTWRHPQVLVIGTNPLPPDASLWSETAIVVGDSPMDDVTLQLRPGATIAGRIRFEGSASPPTMPVRMQTALSVAFEPPWILTFGARMATRVSATWEFVTQGLPPGRYFANLPNNFSDGYPGWYFESATYEGRDLTQSPLVLDGAPITGVDIVFADRRAEISGTILDASGRPSAESAVVIFPAEYTAWIKEGLSPLAAYAVMATDRGTFTLPVRPGAYLVAAIGEEMFETWREAKAIEAIAAGAVRLSIARGDARSLELRRR